MRTWFICEWTGKAWRKVSIEFATFRSAMESQSNFNGDISIFSNRVCDAHGIK